MTRRICVSSLFLPLLVMSAAVTAQGVERYATVYGYGFDKWATAWLLTRKIAPGSRLAVVGRGGDLPAHATPFDVPGAEYVRTGDRSAFAAALEAQTKSASTLERRLGHIVYQIEVAYWQASNTPETLSVEHAFRRLQRGSRRVPAVCYLRFFDSVVAAMRETRPGEPLPAERLLNDCGADATAVDNGAGASSDEPVSEVPIEKILAALRDDREVIFVDVREPAEFAETRIPGAINVPIRSLDEAAVAKVADADMVISYCVKDFRGFEMAKLFWRAGVQHSAIMNPYGLKGWIASGLPVAGRDAVAEDQALAKLRDCLATDSCLEANQ